MYMTKPGPEQLVSALWCLGSMGIKGFLNPDLFEPTGTTSASDGHVRKGGNWTDRRSLRWVSGKLGFQAVWRTGDLWFPAFSL